MKFYKLVVLPFSAMFKSLFNCIIDLLLWWCNLLRYLITPYGVKSYCSVVTLSNGIFKLFKLLFNCPISAYDILGGLCWPYGCWDDCCWDGCWGGCWGWFGILSPKLPNIPPRELFILFIFPNAIVIWGGGTFPICWFPTEAPNIEFTMPMISPKGLTCGGGGMFGILLVAGWGLGTDWAGC